MIDGILLINKSKGVTSYDVIRDLKKKLLVKIKIGHAGTLDPFANGLLIILLGKGTKLMDTFHTLKKGYIVDGVLGFNTDTQDITGKVINRSELQPTLEEIKDVVRNSYVGEIYQMPPIYSAKKVKGKRAYDLAREGKEVVLEPKKVNIFSFDILSYDYPNIKARIICSSGTYIRTLINDVGNDLACYGTAYDLKRISIGGFNVEDCINSCDIGDMSIEDIQFRVLDLDKVKEVIQNGER